jgi:hypothetical protein
MRMTVRLLALALLASLLGSCATMAAYEEQRLARLGKSPASSAKPVEAGTLFQPNVPKPKVDEAALAAAKSVATAEKQLAESDPTKTSDVAPGPVIPQLKTLLQTKADLDVVTKSYLAYAQSVANVRTSLDAYGLKANLEGLRKTREAGEYWALYLQRLRIRGVDQSIKVDDIKYFYWVLSDRGKQVETDTISMNRYIDVQRTRPWVVSNKSSL